MTNLSTLALGLVHHLPDQTTRRAALRQLAYPIIRRWPRGFFSTCVARSPLIRGNTRSHDRAIKVAATPSGFRDAFPDAVLTGIISASFTDRAVMGALCEPSTEGFPSSGSGHGWAFGRPEHYSDQVHDSDVQGAISDARAFAKANGFDKLRDIAIHEGLKPDLADTAIAQLAALLVPGPGAPASAASTAGTTASASSHTKGTSMQAIDLNNIVAAYDVLVSRHSLPEGADTIDRIVKHAVARGALSSDAILPMTNAVAAVVDTRAKSGGQPRPEDLDPAFQPLVDSVLNEWKIAQPVAAPDETLGGSTNIELPEMPVLDVDDKTASLINAVLASSQLPTLDAISKMLKTTREIAEKAVQEAANLRSAASRASLAPAIPTTVAASPSGDIPEGQVVMRKAADVFDIKKGANAFQFEIPTFDWAAPHPHVPVVDPDYMFRPDSLMTLLVALLKGDRPWIYGHTGTGKSTLLEQVAARMNWPVMRVNFDSEITRMDLVGRETLKTDPTTNQTITEWVDGILPTALKGPYILLLDEIDFVRPDVSYVLQRALEGKGLMLTEKGGELVVPHAMNRIVATANTVGQGDESGLYQGARPQSMAFLDRFGPFIHVPYLTKDAEKALIQKRNPTIDPAAADIIARYVHEHRQAFTNAEIMQPISPRGVNALASQYVMYLSIFGDAGKAMRRAFDDTIVHRASQQDAAILKGLVDRVLK